MKSKKNWLRNDSVQALLCSLICVCIGIIIGYLVLLAIDPSGAGQAITAILKNWMNSSMANLL